MSIIKFLAESTINQIAAGEVIERPASVVKELVENAIDAGATKIEIALEQAGKNLIAVSDNGIGMSQEDLAIAVQRHTTSKLNENDLFDIHTFGFRGEALPSIAAISKLSITSRAQNNTKAYQLHLIGGKHQKITPAVCHEGTKIEIRDLFFATPARLKFLRTDYIELAACLDCIRKIALAHPHIAFYLSHNSKSVLKIRKQTEQALSPLVSRISDIMPNNFIENAVNVNFSSNDLSINGYIGIPTFHRATANEQYLFVNNRPIKDKLLHIALRIAYQDYMMKDRYPVAVLFLQIDPQLIDVNAHPTKSEVRFHNVNLVRNLLIKTLKESLTTASHKVSTEVAQSALDSFVIHSNVDTVNPMYLATTFDTFEIADSSRDVSLIKTIKQTSPNWELMNYNDYYNSSTSKNHSLGLAKAQLHNTYIIAQTDNSIIIVDQHAAHERLRYEEMKKIMTSETVVKQRLLTPEIVELSDDRYAQLLYTKRNELSKIGFTIEMFGTKSLIISEIPSVLRDVNVPQLVHDLAEYIHDIGEQFHINALIECILGKEACYHSIRAGRELSIPEMNALLHQMAHTSFSGQCKHGRPAYIELKLHDIEKLFGR